MNTLRSLVAFVAGMILVFIGVLDDCPRVGVIVLGLVLMGLFSAKELIDYIRGRPS